MGFMAIVAFCAMTSQGPNAPAPPYECVWIENEYVFETQTACAIEANRLRRDPILRINAEQALISELGGLPGGQVAWYTFCQSPDELKDFYRHFGVGDLGDIPEDA